MKRILTLAGCAGWMMQGGWLLAATPTIAEPPSPAVARATERWTLAQVEERLAVPGPLGRHDLFWEILRLWQEEEASRTDADMLGIMERLLFDSGLGQDPLLAEPVYGRLSAWAPDLGIRLMTCRLTKWMRMSRPALRFPPPWLAPDFPTMDRPTLAAAVRRIRETGAWTHPEDRVWLAAALAASDDPDGWHEMEAALGAYAETVSEEEQRNLTRQLTVGFARSGVKASLPLLLLEMESEHENMRNGTASDSSSSTRFFQLVGWTEDFYRSGALPRPDLSAVRDWLNRYGSRLSWDTRRRCFTGAPRPGFEGIERFVDTYRVDLPLTLLEDNRGRYELILRIVDLMDRNPKAANDDILVELLVRLLAVSSLFGEDGKDAEEQVFGELPAISPAAAAKVWKNFLRKHIVQNHCPIYAQTVFDLYRNPEILQVACAALRPETKERYEASRNLPLDIRLPRALAYLCVGGRVPDEELEAMLAEARTSKKPNMSAGLLFEWAKLAIIGGNLQGMWLMLAVAEGMPGFTRHRLEEMEFYFFGKVSSSEKHGRRAMRARIAACRRWLEENESHLVFVPRSGVFRLASVPAH